MLTTVLGRAREVFTKVSFLEERMQLLNSNLHYATLASLLSTSVVYSLLYDAINDTQLLIWLFSSFALVALRGVLTYLYKSNHSRASTTSIFWTYIAVVLASGMCWGVVTGLFVNMLDLQARLFCYLLLSIMVGGSITTLSASAVALYGYLAPILLPALVSTVLTPEPYGPQFLLGLLSLLFILSGSARSAVAGVNSTLEAHSLANQRSRLAAEAKHRLSLTQKSTPLAYVEFDLQFCVTEWNPAAESLFGISRQEAIKKNVPLFAGDLVDGEENVSTDAMRDFFNLALQRNQPVFTRNRCADGRTRDCDWYCTLLESDEGTAQGYAAYVQDITGRLQQQKQMERRASHDELTGLPNRIALNERLNAAITRSLDRDSCGALLFINIDEFKQVNDAFGHGEGDEALQELAKRMQQVLAKDEFLARFGGDEFVVLIENLYGSRSSMERYVAQRAAHLVDAASRSINIKNTEFTFGASMGISLFPDTDSCAANVVLRKAALALREVKGSTKGKAGFYDDALNQAVRERVEILSGIRKALTQSEFKLFVQPKLSLAENRIIGGEALVRWHQPGKGMIAPALFIPILEKSPYVYEFGEWTLREGLRLISMWREQALCSDDFCLAINISARQLLDERFPELVERSLKESNIAGRSIEFEITENVLIENFKKVESTLHQIRDLGVRIAIDDFGTGYSSLSYLQRLPVSTIKIDRSFVRDIAAEEDNTRSIITAILSMGHGLGLDVVAEGIETSEQFKILRELKCDSYQGFAFSPAVSAQRFAEFLDKEKRNAA